MKITISELEKNLDKYIGLAKSEDIIVTINKEEKNKNIKNQQ